MASLGGLAWLCSKASHYTGKKKFLKLLLVSRYSCWRRSLLLPCFPFFLSISTNARLLVTRPVYIYCSRSVFHRVCSFASVYPCIWGKRGDRHCLYSRRKGARSIVETCEPLSNVESSFSFFEFRIGSTFCCPRRLPSLATIEFDRCAAARSTGIPMRMSAKW